MKESTAWRILAEDHDAGTTSWYLCNTLTNPEHYGAKIAKAPYSLRQTMIGRIKDNLDIDGNGTAYRDATASSEEQRDGRTLACLMFAEQARDEEKAGA